MPLDSAMTKIEMYLFPLMDDNLAHSLSTDGVLVSRARKVQPVFL